MDVVYIVRAGHHNEELRYSLRSLRHLKHDRVWIAGFRPNWVTGVEIIPVPQIAAKHENTWANWRAIGATADVSDELVLFNDDFFVLRELDRPPVVHAGPLDEWLASINDKSPTARRMHRTIAALEDAGRKPEISWERHLPMVLDRRWLAEVIAYGEQWRARNPGEPLCKRTLYGNYAGLGGGEVITDCKIRDARSLPGPAWPYVSTSDYMFRGGRVGQWLRAQLPDRSPYEKA